MFSKFTEEARRILVGAKKEMADMCHPYVGSEHLILSILKDRKNDISKKLKNYGLTYEKFKNELIRVLGKSNSKSEWFLYTPLLKRIIENAIIDSRENNKGEVTVLHLFLAMLEEGEGVAIRVMVGMNLSLDDLYTEFSKDISFKKSKGKSKLFIDEFGVDMNKRALQNELDPVIGRDNEIERILEILCRRTKNNPILLGDAGVGKSALVEELSRRISSGDVPLQLKNKRIVSIAMSSLVSGTKYRGEFEERITKLLKELEENNEIILFIDEIHTLVGAGGAEGAIDASNILKPALARGKIRLIGATTTLEYKKFIEDDRALSRRFQPVYVEEPDTEQVYKILLQLKPIYESYHGVFLDDEILRLITDLSNKYIYDRKQPDKAIDILDEVCSHVSIMKDEKVTKLNEMIKKVEKVRIMKNDAIINNDFIWASRYRTDEKILNDKINKLELSFYKKNKNKKVTKEMVADVIHKKSKIPVYEILNDDYSYLTKLENYLNEQVIAQSQVISKLCTLTKRIRLGYQKEHLPMSFLFVGPTGVGKTLLAKEYSNFLYGNDNFIRLDMSEYKEEHSISKIIGSPPGYVGYTSKNTILDEIRNHPNAVILLDEIEKAHPSVIQSFLQVLDYGKMKSATGEECRFDHNIIIMTSNVGCSNQKIGFCEDKEENLIEQLKEFFSIEFINRIDSILVFNSFSKEDITKIIQKKIKLLKQHYHQLEDIKISSKVIEQLIELSKYSLFGARKIDKVISMKIDDLLINDIIEGRKTAKIESLL